MEITSQVFDGGIEVKPVGRLDAHWADHLTKVLEETLRQGHDSIRLNLSGCSYISSIGIRVLVMFSQKLKAVEGTFVVTEPSEAVSKVLDMVGLRAVLMPAATAPKPAAAATAPKVQTLQTANASFEVFPLTASATMACRLTGNPALLEAASFTARDCTHLAFPESAVGIGIGAFGESFDQCRDRFGEFLSVAGASVYQPADGSNAADSQISQGSFVPELQVLYGATCEGAFRALGRFEPRETGTPTGLAEIASAALQIAGSDHACVAIVAESAGLIGASLRRPPVNGSGSPFAFPEVRRWLSFTTEPVHTRALTLVVGIVSKAPSAALDGILRPLGAEASPRGHFHAAAFSYRPLQRGVIDLVKTTRALFENEALLGLKHLIGDDRPGGLSESKFYRGACWVSPIADVHRS